eukprot:2158354-Pyramimonas_sp.AAC.1
MKSGLLWGQGGRVQPGDRVRPDDVPELGGAGHRPAADDGRRLRQRHAADGRLLPGGRANSVPGDGRAGRGGVGVPPEYAHQGDLRPSAPEQRVPAMTSPTKQAATRLGGVRERLKCFGRLVPKIMTQEINK